MLLPFVVDTRLTDMWELPRATVLWLGSLLALLSLLAERIISRRFVYRPLGAAGWSAAAVLGAVTLSTITSVSAWRSLVGEMGRYEGLLTFVSYAALFYVASQTLSDANGFGRIATLVTTAAAVVSVYGISQFLGFDPLTWPMGRFESYRAFSTLGNPLYLGEYLAFCLPLALSRTILLRGYGRFFSLAGTALIATCLAASVTRGSWIGAAIGVAVTLVFLLRSIRDARPHVTHAIGSTAAILAVVAAVMVVSPSAEATRARLTSSLTLLEGTTGTRIELLRSSAFMFIERPLLGWGPDTYRLVYPQYATARHYQLAGRDVIADNAHNYPAQLAVSGGLLTVGAFYGLALVCFARAGSRRRSVRQSKATLLAGMVGAVAGYLGALLFGISIIAASALMWTALGMLAGHLSDARVRDGRVPERWRRPVLGGLAAVLAVATLGLVLPYRAEITFSKALSAAQDGAAPEAVARLFRHASEQAPYQEQYMLAAGFYFNDLAQATGDYRYRLAAVERFLAAQKAAPLETNSYTMLGATYLDLANATGNDDYRALGIEQLLEQAELAPNFAPGHYLLGRAYLEEHEPERAIVTLKTAVGIDPDYAEAWRALARAYEATGQSALARDADEQAAAAGG
jgi:putative inorganic carbon (HCO3(-)) transporter